MPFPPALLEIIELFEFLSEPERREMLINYAEAAPTCARLEGEIYEVADVRRDEECTDTVGVFLKVGADERVNFAIEFGPKVQTLTKAMATILYRGLDGCTAGQILNVSPDFVPRIIGAELVRLRSQTVYYMLKRLKEAIITAAPRGSDSR